MLTQKQRAALTKIEKSSNALVFVVALLEIALEVHQAAASAYNIIIITTIWHFQEDGGISQMQGMRFGCHGLVS